MNLLGPCVAAIIALSTIALAATMIAVEVDKAKAECQREQGLKLEFGRKP